MNQMNKEKNEISSKTKKNEYQFHCSYCQKPMSKFDFETYKGICGKCREIADWKQILHDVKQKK